MLRLAVVAAIAACSSPPPPPVAPRPAVPDGVLPPRGMLLIGDVHGTVEIPAFVASIVTAAAASQPVVLALEVTRQDTPGLDAFLASDGAAPAVARVLRDPWWLVPFQDGRRSIAMLDLLRTVRELRARGAAIAIEPFEAGPGDATDQGGREEHMANTLLALRRARPEATIVVYAGRLHTMRKGTARPSGAPVMANRLASAGVAFVTLAPRHGDGTAWVCRTSVTTSCAPSLQSGDELATGIHLEASRDGNFDGWFGVGAITASPPAAFPAQSAGLGARLAAMRANAPAIKRAATAYGAKDYQACADAYASLAEPTGEDAYNHACCLAQLGRRDDAFEHLQRAIARGYAGPAELAHDADLAPLHDDPRWPPKP